MIRAIRATSILAPESTITTWRPATSGMCVAGEGGEGGGGGPLGDRLAGLEEADERGADLLLADGDDAVHQAAEVLEARSPGRLTAMPSATERSAGATTMRPARKLSAIAGAAAVCTP